MAESSYDIRNFAQLLGALEDGVLLDDLSSKLDALVAELKDANASRGGKQVGAIQLTIELAYRDQVFDVKADYKIKTPKEVRGRTVLWATEDRRLSRANPKQFGLPLRQVDRAAPELKTL